MARKPRSEESGSLDSLLDTMTNVVGILVIILIVTQINVSETLKRIDSNLPKVEEEDVVKLEALLDENRKTRERLETTWTKEEPKENQEKKLLEQLRLEIDDVAKENKEVVEKSTDLEELKKLIAEHKEKVVASGEEVKKADEELQRLKAMLDETPDREVLPPKVVNLPNPRPAPENAHPRTILCRYNKVYIVGDVYEHLFKVRDFIDANFDNLVFRGPGMGSYTYTIPSTKKNDAGNYDSLRNRDGQAYQKFRYDAALVTSFFEKGRYGGNDLWYQVVRATSGTGAALKQLDSLELRIVPKEEGGMTVEEFKKRNSPLDLAFKKEQIDRNYLIFLVAPDSFDAYLEAREMAEFYRIPSGWQPWTAETFSPTTRVAQETTSITIADLPLAAILNIQTGVTPIVDKNLEEAQAQFNSVKDPAAKPEAEAWLKKFAGYASAVKSVHAVAASMRGTHPVQISPGPPNIPHIRVFLAEGAIPTTAPAPPPAPPKGADPVKKEPPKPKGDTLD